jgi:hypothetical protein
VAVVNHEAVPIVVCATDHPKFMLSARTGVGIEFLRFRLPIMVERASFRRGVVGGGGAGGRGRARAGGGGGADVKIEGRRENTPECDVMEGVTFFDNPFPRAARLSYNADSSPKMGMRGEKGGSDRDLLP